jgi:hypothetical protein
MQLPSRRSTGFLQQIRMIHFAVMAGVILFLAVSLYLTMSGYLQPEYEDDFSNVLFLLTAAMTVVILPFAYLLFNRKVRSMDKNRELPGLMMDYKSVFMVKMGLIETPVFFSIVVLLLTGNQWLLVQIVAVLIVMVINRPSAEKIVHELGLDRSEIEAIQNL